MEEFNRQEELLEKYKKGLCTPHEKAMVEHWYNTQSASALDQLPDPRYPDTKEDIWKAISTRIEEQENKDPDKPNWILNTKRILIAASIFISVAVGVYYFTNPGSSGAEQYASKSKEQIKPGGNKAYLTLSNGKRIVLSDSTTGTLAMQSGVQITKTADGQLVYKVTAEAEAEVGQYNVLEAPKGGQYQIVLIDGTKVWLNSASVLKYPARFSASERRVELTGEAYFEVAKDKTKPFRVLTNDQEIEVLGTQFNINAYTDESSIKTTLVEGSVSVKQLAIHGPHPDQVLGAAVLKPGQQSVLQQGSIQIKKADVEEAIAWKNGYFIFENDDLNSIMRKLERWYDVEVVYKGTEDNKTKVMGAIARNTELPEVLKLLEATGKFKFKTEGRRITIMQ